MNRKILILGFVLAFAIFAYAAITAIDFNTPIADRMIAKCQGDLQCYDKVDVNGSFARFFTLVHEDGTIEKIVLIEDYPIEITKEIK